MNWGCVSSGRALVLQVQSPEFNFESHQKKEQSGTVSYACNYCYLGDRSGGSEFEASTGRKFVRHQAPVTHAHNRSYSGGRDQEDHDSMPF
jgi:hypothetical protein